MTMWVYTTKKVSELLKSSFILPKFNSHLELFVLILSKFFLTYTICIIKMPVNKISYRIIIIVFLYLVKKD